jgi:hypothetical protein
VSFFPQILLFDILRTISKDVEVYSIVIHLFLKASGFFVVGNSGLTLQQPNGCF